MKDEISKREVLQIVDDLIRNAKGKLTSRYVLGLERARDSIEQGSSTVGIRRQNDWYKNLTRRK